MSVLLLLNAALYSQALPGDSAASGQDAQLISKPKVKLPKEAKESGLGGTVNVLVSLDAAGNVLSVEDITGPGAVCRQVNRQDVAALREAAEAGALKSKFSPTKRNGEAVASTTWVTFDFPGSKGRGEFVFTATDGTNRAKGDRNYDAANAPPPDYQGPVKTGGISVAQVEKSEEKGPPKTLSGGVLNGKAAELPKPQFPRAARAVRVSGAVPVQVLIDEKGEVFMAQAAGGHPLLRYNAVTAACGAKFMPTLLSGQPVKVVGIITYNFVP